MNAVHWNYRGAQTQSNMLTTYQQIWNLYLLMWLRFIFKDISMGEKKKEQTITKKEKITSVFLWLQM